MNINPLILLIVLLGTLFLSSLSLRAVRGIWKRLLILGFFSGLCFYSGIGAAYSDVPYYYLLYYFGFLCAFAFAFWLFNIAFANLSSSTGQRLTRVFSNVDVHPAWLLVIYIYLLSYIVPLIYPELRLQDLFLPPHPDLLASFARRWELQKVNILQKLVEYARVLLTPFFYIALFRYRQKLGRIILIFVVLLYLQYVGEGYVGRSPVIIAFATILLGLWVIYPKRRPVLIAISIIAIFFVLALSYWYMIIRIGGNPRSVTPIGAALNTLEIETTFPRDVGIPIIESGARVDLAAYAKWIITLPIPKLITGEIEGARVNYEISELIFQRGRGQRGYYIVLA
ncbi:MAG: hypothetical protein NC828_02585, partial [Candidatus Omnitrophica bacterium]|nr:hypothetical protein [Candidatus Omnitrophota bacterium]